MELLISELESNMRMCKWAIEQNYYDAAKNFYGQAFGKVIMFRRLCPELETTANELWNEKYRPWFEKIVYGG